MYGRNRNRFGLSFDQQETVKTWTILGVVALLFLAFCHELYVEAEQGIDGNGVGAGFSDDHRALNAARALGLRNPSVYGVAPLYECGQGDAWFSSARVMGTNANDDTVTVIVCCGPLEGFSKACTVRF